eukprot:GCRY01000776.1.p1 GENE.GCRY01000776.1~~GCRY01000776.1.p1  ORF type:complete len:483 (-),score=130.65 GCRY01000776.1:111-1559(-)
MVNKVFKDAATAVADIPNDVTIMCGGFGLTGIPENCIRAMVEKGTTGITTISNDVGSDSFGLAQLLPKRQIKKSFVSGVWFSEQVSGLYMSGEVAIEFTPQGTLAERIRAGGAGIPAFYTPAGAGTVIEEGGMPIKYAKDGSVEIAAKGREAREFNGRRYLLEEALTADYAFIKAKKGDALGNLVFHGSANNFNLSMASAAKITIAEVEELVPVGDIKPDEVHCPGIHVQRIFQGAEFRKPILKLCNCKETDGEDEEKVLPFGEMSGRERIARRTALEFEDGMYVNLGIGIPTTACQYMKKDIHITLQSENGMLGFGNYPRKGEEDPDVVNAGVETVTLPDGSSTFDSSYSFAMIRGQKVQLTCLGGMQVAENGDLANWIIPKVMVKGMGGAMDLVSSGSRVIVTMEHNTKKGGAKILKKCALPITGAKCVNRIITELAVFDVIDEKLVLVELGDTLTVEELKAKTEADFVVSDKLTAYRLQ